MAGASSSRAIERNSKRKKSVRLSGCFNLLTIDYRHPGPARKRTPEARARNGRQHLRRRTTLTSGNLSPPESAPWVCLRPEGRHLGVSFVRVFRRRSGSRRRRDDDNRDTMDGSRASSTRQELFAQIPHHRQPLITVATT
jgi:hypothetical protein